MLGDSSVLSPAPETWRAVVGFEGRYEVSDQGRVRSLRVRGTHRGGSYDRLRPKPRVLLGSPNRGYPRVSLGKGNGRQVHRLVLEAFVGPCPDGHEASHLDGQPGNNRLLNLIWEPHVDNLRRRRVHGTVPAGERHYTHVHPELVRRGDDHSSRRHPERLARGERNPSAKLTAETVRVIRSAVRAGESQQGLARKYDVSAMTINAIVHRRTWAHVEDDLVIRRVYGGETT